MISIIISVPKMRHVWQEHETRRKLMLVSISVEIDNPNAHVSGPCIGDICKGDLVG